MYIEMTPKHFKELKEDLPDDMSLWLTEETINSLKEIICAEDLQNIKEILYRDFLKSNLSFLNCI